MKALVRLATVLIDDSPAEAPAENVAVENPTGESVHRLHVPKVVPPEQDLDWGKVIVPVPEPPPDPSPEAASVTPAVSDLESETVCGELFAEGRMSFETTQIFEKRYQGQRVRWSGTLDRIEPFRDDQSLGRRSR